MPTDTLFLSAGWLFIASLVAALAIYRTILALHEHQFLKFGPARAASVDSNMSARLGSVNRYGIFLTIAMVIYSVGFAIVLAEQTLQAVVDSFARLFVFF